MWHALSACWCKNSPFLLPIKHRAGHVARSVFSGLHFWAFSFLSPLKSRFWNAFLLWYRKRLFCESPFFPKWPGSYFQKLSRVPFLKDSVWVTMSYSAVSASVMCTTLTNSPLLHFKLCDISVNTPSALSLIIASPFVLLFLSPAQAVLAQAFWWAVWPGGRWQQCCCSVDAGHVLKQFCKAQSVILLSLETLGFRWFCYLCFCTILGCPAFSAVVSNERASSV